MSETSDVVRPTLAVLNRIPGVIAFRIHSGRVRVKNGFIHLGEAGAPDIGCVVAGQAIFFEAKSPKGKVRDEQVAWHARGKRAGARIWIIRKPKHATDVVRSLLGGTP